ncbi:MAG: hypothetical protein ACXWCR_15205, partial [Flavitalea sp.]
MKLVEVTDSKTEKDFLMVNVLMNKGNPEYIRPLDKDIQEVFDPKKNKAFRFGKAIRWILKDESGQLIGRIAAFMNKKYRSAGDEFPVGGIGFFDCINDQQAANFLFDTAKKWLAEEGVEAMDGPINFGERDKWWGLLVKGFQSPLYNMNYNPPYYQELFENYGFQTFFNQHCYGMKVRTKVQDKLYARHAKIEA